MGSVVGRDNVDHPGGHGLPEREGVFFAAQRWVDLEQWVKLHNALLGQQ